jgi:hypothetical protein
MQCKSQGLKEVEYDRNVRGHAPIPSSTSVELADCSHVDVLGPRYKSVNWGAKTSRGPVSPNSLRQS